MTENDKKPFDHPDYRIEGTNMFNMSKWIRENFEHPEPRFKVGDKVIFTLETEITSVDKDCDGSTLYEADMIGANWGEYCFAPLPTGDNE